MKRLVVRIDRLVLRGYRPADGRALSAALRKELGRLLAAPGSAERAAALGAVARLDVAAVRVPPGAAPRAVGSAAARAISGAIRR
jgi:hypothetical protein